jgi:type IX secretion system PorP/SprF family membrane protein
MKRILLALTFFCFMSVISYAQQRPQYTLYNQNNFLINPAVAGIENYYDTKLSYRTQWAGLESAPQTGYFSLQGPIGDVSSKHSGIGGYVVSDKTGPSVRNSFNLAYAYHLPVNRTINLSFGLSGGITQYSLDGSKLNPNDPNDPSITNGKANQILPDLGAGLWLYSTKFYVGVSGQQLVPATLDFGTNNGEATVGDNSYKAHFFLTSGYRFAVGEDFLITPSILCKFVSPAPTSVDLTLKAMYMETIWGAVSYRTSDSFAISMGVNISSTFNIGYGYDFGVSGLSEFHGGSHEILLGFQINNKGKSKCPRNVW